MFRGFLVIKRHFHIFQECSKTSCKLNIILKNKIKTSMKYQIYTNVAKDN